MLNLPRTPRTPDTFIGIVREFPEGEGEKKKIKGRSPVPSIGTIIEPHTDKSLNITFPVFSLDPSFSGRGWGLKLFL